MSDFTAVANQFVKFYYETFDQNRGGLASLYRDTSLMTFESTPVQGVAGITEKLTSLPFQKVQHRVDTLDAQPTHDGNGILILVTGALLVDEEQRPMNYTQTFQLISDGAGSFYVANDLFKLVYG